MHDLVSLPILRAGCDDVENLDHGKPSNTDIYIPVYILLIEIVSVSDTVRIGNVPTDERPRWLGAHSSSAE